jgi:hypothetical protein
MSQRVLLIRAWYRQGSANDGVASRSCAVAVRCFWGELKMELLDEVSDRRQQGIRALVEAQLRFAEEGESAVSA